MAAGAPDVAACRHWRPSVDFAGLRLGLVPAWNAVVGLNGTAAEIWDLLAGAPGHGTLAERYRARRPDRAAQADTDIADCLAAWRAQGLFDPPPFRDVPAFEGETVGCPAFRRGIAVAGRSVVLEVDDPGLAATVADMTAGFPDGGAGRRHVLRVAGPEGGWRLCLEGRVFRRERDAVALRGALVSELIRLAGDWHAMVHGAVLARDGRAVFLAGPSGAGKSTLAAGLVARGWQMVAEDCAPFDAEMRVVPLPFALSVKEGSVAALAGLFPGLAGARVHVLGRRKVRYQPLPQGAVATHPVRPDLVVDLRYRRDFPAAHAICRTLSPLDRLRLFLTEDGYVDFERDLRNAFLRFVETTPGIALEHGGLDAAEGAILRQLDRVVERCSG
ncbi:PqqD family peptide modification chaperone [Rhodovulum marinum]|uniref:Hpr(Ser) kinase/phosphatase n=1 Tax=Rhodovulum marinum TaxID=320662 RepID=A0A4R2PTM6_9RHOB|nr:PqqD family peptide modification chaperone [Rhodovulum marinum]TCP39280.1 hypothetical protein EV662_11357 [Rhodovulum marinum]